MKFALVNPDWNFNGSIYFGCKHYHLPLEFGYASQLLKNAGHETLILDAHLESLRPEDILKKLCNFAPDITVITTAPTYLFWRCPPPELIVPRKVIDTIRLAAGTIAVVGPHGSVTPEFTLEKLGADVVVIGECEEVIPQLAVSRKDWHSISSICYLDGKHLCLQGQAHASDMNRLGAIAWPDAFIAKHNHQHHRFDAQPSGPGAEMETSRGCPYHCSFCAKHSFRDKFRKRPIEKVLEELDGLISQGAEYIYFVDEIFWPDEQLLEALADRPITYGIQTRIDIWNPDMLDKLGISGCVSIEAGVESITEQGRALLNKNCRLNTAQISELLIRAKETVPFVQATLMNCSHEKPEQVEDWRKFMGAHGIWANKPVPLFPYPGTLEYARRWGMPDQDAWQRALDYYISINTELSDIQEEKPLSYSQLEAGIK